MYGEKEFSKDVIEMFGNEISELSEDPEMIHSQMGYLADGIRNKLPYSDNILKFVDSLLRRKDAVLEIEEFPSLGLESNIPPNIFRVLKEQQQRWLRAKNT